MGDHCWIVTGMARWTETTDSCFTNCSTQNAFCSGVAIIALLRHRPREKRGVGLRMRTKLEHLLFRSMWETYFCVRFDSPNGRFRSSHFDTHCRMGLSNNPTCRKCGTEEETSVHILYECEALASLRRTYLGSFFLNLEDIRKLGMGTNWNFGRNRAPIT